MTAQIRFDQTLKQAQGCLIQFKEIDRKVRNTSYIGFEAFGLLHTMFDLRAEMESISKDGFSESQKAQFQMIYSQCAKIYNRTRKDLIQTQQEVVHDLELEMSKFYDSFSKSPEKQKENNVVETFKSFKGRLDQVENLGKNKELDALICNVKELMLEPETWEKITGLSYTESLASSIPASTTSPLSCELGLAADRLAQIETMMYVSNPDLEVVLNSLAEITTEVSSTADGSGAAIAVGGLVLYHLHMIQIQAGHPGAATDEPTYIMRAFQDLEGASSTLEQRQRALNRAKVDVLLQAYRAAAEENAEYRLNRYFKALDFAYSDCLEGTIDAVPALGVLENYGAYNLEDSQKRLMYIDQVRVNMYQAWNLT
jgi:hypothetical protein